MKSLLALVLLSGCAIDASIEGKSCPCAEGYECDVLRNTCARSLCQPALGLADFAPLWATPHDIRWGWQTTGPEARFLRYELRLAESKEQLASGDAMVFDASQNPELGLYRLPGSTDAVTATTTRGLEAAKTYYAQFLVVDIDECAFASDPLARTTAPEPTGTVPVFRDDLPEGHLLLPPVAMLTTDADGAHIHYDAGTDPECFPPGEDLELIKDTCGQPLRPMYLGVDVAHDPNPQVSRLSEGTFEGAYVEVHLSNASPIPSWYTNFWLWLENCTVEYHYDTFTLPASADYVRFEVPLTALIGGAGPMSYATVDTQASGTQVCGLGLGPTWHETSVGRLDNVLIRF